MTTTFPDATAATLGVLREIAPSESAFGSLFPEQFPDGDVPSLPYTRAGIDASTVENRALARSSMRITVWAETSAQALNRAWRLHALLLDYGGGAHVRGFEPLAGPVPADDPDSGRPLASFTVAAKLRPVSL